MLIGTDICQDEIPGRHLRLNGRREEYKKLKVDKDPPSEEMFFWFFIVGKGLNAYGINQSF